MANMALVTEDRSALDQVKVAFSRAFCSCLLQPPYTHEQTVVNMVAALAKQRLTENQLAAIQEAASDDKEGVGVISGRQLDTVMHHFGFVDTDAALVRELLIGNTGESSAIDFSGFLTMMGYQVVGNSETTLAKCFSRYDKQNTGAISAADILKGLCDLKQNIEIEQLGQMVTRRTIHVRDQISYEEFALCFAVASALVQVMQELFPLAKLVARL
jgi:Ca2+-binding EF-hand superfamily protein